MDQLHEVNIAPSILSADFARLGDDVGTVLDAGARVIHVDVMDGHFVPNITIGPLVVKAIAPLVHGAGALLDVHLMIERPELYVEDFAAAGADVIVVHQEACTHLHRVLTQIREAGAAAGRGPQPGDARRDAGRGARALRPRGDHVGQPGLRRSVVHRDVDGQAQACPGVPAGERRHRGRRRRERGQRRPSSCPPAPRGWSPARACSAAPTWRRASRRWRTRPSPPYNHSL